MNRTRAFPQPTIAARAVSLALASLMAGHALAQQAAPPAPASTPSGDTAARLADPGDVQKVVVSTRRSQQSSIDRKKNASTAMDSIVAEDVGSLPDRNIGEAISRMAGVAIDRGEYGEGVSLSVRGNGASLTRVELDGMSVQSAGGSDLNGGGDGRGVEFRSLSADLIKSVDVIKGQTADMVEGSLGGGIRIQTRTGLDFRKPFVSVRASGTQHSLNEKWTPDVSFTGARQFGDGRLGVVVNANYQKLDNEAHQTQTSGSGQNGYGRYVDIDNSPEKTFTFQPGSLDMSNPASLEPTTTLKDAGGRVIFSGATPQDLLRRAAAAQSKDECFNAFPQLTKTSAALAGLSSDNINKAIDHRGNELLTCLNQWNDYSPQLLRYFVKRQVDVRKGIDLRTDFKVNEHLTVYAKGSYSRRTVDDHYMTYNLGQVGVNGTGNYVDANGVRTAAPGIGYHTSPYTYGLGASGTGVVRGAAVNFNPATAVVDATHHLTSFSLDNGGAGTDQIRNLMEVNTKYLQFGGTFKRDALTAELLVGASRSDFRRANARWSVSFNNAGPATASVGPNGTWGYDFANGIPDNGDPANYGATVVNTNPAMPNVTSDRTLLWQSPQIRETDEQTAKLDLSYALSDRIPVFKYLKSGFNLRRSGNDSWGAGGYTVRTAQGTAGQPNYSPAITVPSTEVRGVIRGCTDTPGSAGTANACKYGYTPGTAPSLSGTWVLPMQDFQNLLGAAMTDPATATKLFNGASGRPGNTLDNWSQLDVLKVIDILKMPNYDYHCTRECAGSDGQVYQQPIAKVREESRAFYLMTDFGFDTIPFTRRALPFGWEVDGNFGYRYVHRKVQGTGSMTFRVITKTPRFDPANPDAEAGIATSSVTQNTAIDATSHVFLPSYNVGLWLIPNQLVARYSAAKSSALPPVSRLLASGTCTYDERDAGDVEGDDGNLRCNTVGNPALQGQSNFNQNLSVEWYPNADTMFSVAGYRQEGRIGPNKTTGVFDVPLFAGSSGVNPVTGQPLSDIVFDYTTYTNGPPATRTGIEFGTRSAFTFLPSYLRHTGLDANYTRQKSTMQQAMIDPLTGEAQPQSGEPKYSYNLALWYDDGKLAARVAVQAVAAYYGCTAPCGATGTNLNSYPAFNVNAPAALPWNPGTANIRDATRFIDARISYKLRPELELFVEGRNLSNQTETRSIASTGYSDGTPYLQNYAYAGRRVTVGLVYRGL
ncbi:TonB-dependent receptor [Pseudoduganella sp. SL102]|uniref:TonB-dependent receptor n=1 Tax=Pseudoduganella sp. SL102 TaxID=2995154 RepID=UPI00248D2D6D|nr:TonB-dependent receptor [Pseudoduganella sp. SL102]WBS00443.1 TonB-dependent receptor [Pseudoduganella sp. SL102]